MKALLFTLFALSLSEPTISAQVEVQVLPQPQVHDQPSPILGGYTKMDVKSAAELDRFLDSKVRGISGLKLVEYQRQVVNGFNHRLVYEDKHHQKRAVIVYESIEGELEIVADSEDQQEM